MHLTRCAGEHCNHVQHFGSISITNSPFKPKCSLNYEKTEGRFRFRPKIEIGKTPRPWGFPQTFGCSFPPKKKPNKSMGTGHTTPDLAVFHLIPQELKTPEFWHLPNNECLVCFCQKNIMPEFP